MMTAGAVAMMAAPASAASPCEAGCSLGTTSVGANGGSLDYTLDPGHELGIQFHVNAPGVITNILFYVAPTEVAQGNHKATLWLVGTGPIASQTQGVVAGVNSFSIPPTAVTPGNTYIASYGEAAAFGYNGPPDTANTTSGTLVGEKGIFGPQNTIPVTSNGNSYGVDVRFVEAPAPPVITGTVRVSSSSVAVSFTDSGTSGVSFTVTCTPVPGGPSATTGVGTGTTSPITVTGLTADVLYTCVVTATNLVGSATSAPSSPFVDVSVSGPGCSGTIVTGPTQLSAASMAFPGAVVSWAPAVVDLQSCLGGYVVTPIEGTTPLAPSFVTASHTTTHVLNLELGHTYTFTVAAVSGTTIGDPSDPVGPVTIGTPAAAAAVHAAHAGKGAIKVTFKTGNSNGSPITSFTVGCRSSNGGHAASRSGKASPITVGGLTPGKAYACVVRATNRRGIGTASSRALARS